jgi:hypothetical protein
MGQRYAFVIGDANVSFEAPFRPQIMHARWDKLRPEAGVRLPLSL